MNAETEPILKFKVILIGDAGVGKTSLANRQAYQQFSNSLQPTIGTGIFDITMEAGSTKVQLKVWDTAGHEKFKSVIPIYSKDTSLCVLVASIDAAETINHLEQWKTLIERNVGDIIFFVVINKIDLVGTDNVLSVDDLREQMMDRYAHLHFVSAKTNDNVAELFDSIARECLNSCKGIDMPEKLPNQSRSGCC